jgi:hypothetical protein
MNRTSHSGTTENQRTDRRHLVNVESSFRGVPTRTRARIADLSCSGARLEHRPDKPWKASTQRTLVIELEREEAPPLRLFALPVWSTPHALGVKFLLLDDMDRLALAEIIDEHRLAA